MCTFKINITLYYFFAVIFFSSCGIPGFTSNYSKLTEEQKALVKDFDPNKTCEVGKIYTITGTQLREEIKKYPKAMVYEFTNGCSSSRCYPLFSFKKYANDNDYQLFLVMNGYGNIEKTLIQDVKTPLFVINHKYYKSNIRYKYSKRFIKDFLSVYDDYKDSKLGDYSIFVFEDGKLIKAENDLMNLISTGNKKHNYNNQ